MATNLSTTEGTESPIEELIKQWFHALGGTNYPVGTTERVTKYFSELVVKRHYEKLTKFDSKTDEMIVVNRIRIFSFCEHHLLPFFGYVSIGYIPDGHIFGLSKFQRLVDKLASTPTIQETLTGVIADSIVEHLQPRGVGVVMDCQHTCMFGRGIERPEISVSTQVLRGNFKEHGPTREEFFNRIKQ